MKSIDFRPKAIFNQLQVLQVILRSVGRRGGGDLTGILDKEKKLEDKPAIKLFFGPIVEVILSFRLLLVNLRD